MAKVCTGWKNIGKIKRGIWQMAHVQKWIRTGKFLPNTFTWCGWSSHNAGQTTFTHQWNEMNAETKKPLIQCVNFLKPWYFYDLYAWPVAWPLNESEAVGDLVLIETALVFLHKLILISMRTASLTSKQGHLQPHFHSKARQLSTQL